jgi:hypothetical protein
MANWVAANFQVIGVQHFYSVAEGRAPAGAANRGYILPYGGEDTKVLKLSGS